jgi:hypothetical protein
MANPKRERGKRLKRRRDRQRPGQQAEDRADDRSTQAATGGYESRQGYGLPYAGGQGYGGPEGYGPGRQSGEQQYGGLEGYRGQGQPSQYGMAGRGEGQYLGRSGYAEEHPPGMALRGAGLRRGGFRGRGPRNYRRSDERITEEINDRLTDHDELDAADIEVNVTGGEVILLGTVDSRESKRLAEDIVESVSGVTQVQNQLRVARPEDHDRQARGQRQSAGPAKERGRRSRADG